MEKNVSRLLITAINSGSGKTLFTMGLLRLLQNKGLNVSSYKCGPDYIDTSFHKKALNLPCRNIDLFLSDTNTVKNILSESSNIAIIEGVMGFYDGIAYSSSASSYEISMKTNTPAVLIIDAKGKAATLKALIYGMLKYKENNIRAVILNRIHKQTYEIYKKIIEDELNIKVAGFLPEMKDVTLKSRHLGLITAEEIKNIDDIINKTAENINEFVDVNMLLNIANKADPLIYEEMKIDYIGKCKIGIARDEAFCFYYEDNIKVLEKMGAEIIYFSPLYDKKLPEGLQGLIFYGGYPELYIEKLSKNESFIHSLQKAYENNIPLMAECGGYMYISKSIDNVKSASLIEGSAYMTNKLQNFGYINVTSQKDSMILKKGEVIKAHEFHYSKMDNECNDCFMQKPSSTKNWVGAKLEDNLYAGYPHLYYLGNINIAKRFIEKALNYKTDNL